MINKEKSGENFEWLVTLCSSLGMGAAAAFVFSIESVNPTVRFAFDWTVGASFLFGAWLTFLGCRVLFFSGSKSESDTVMKASKRRWFIGLTILGLGGTVSGMAYSLKGVSREKLLDVGFGVLLAAFMLSLLSVLFLRTIRFLNADEKKNALTPSDLE